LTVQSPSSWSEEAPWLGRGEKYATRDIDLIVELRHEGEELKKAVEGAGFEVDARRIPECARVDASIFSGVEGMRVDVFVGTICDELVLSQGMKSRAEFIGDYGRMSLHLCSREDIFLLKSVTERDKDLDDIVLLFRRCIDERIILEGCRAQGKLDDLLGGGIWEAFLLIKIREMERKYEVSVPWKRQLGELALQKLEKALVLKEIRKGASTIPGIAGRLELGRSRVGAVVSRLEEEGIVSVDRAKRPFRIAKK